MSAPTKRNEKKQVQEIILKAQNGMPILLINIILMLLAIFVCISGIRFAANGINVGLGIAGIITGALYFLVVGPIIFAGLKVLRPQEALVLTLFGKYYGTLKGEGFYFVNPFVSAVNPAATAAVPAGGKEKTPGTSIITNKKISLKAMTLNNDKQKNQ